MRLPCLLEVAQKCQKVRENPEFQAIFKKEIEYRAKFSFDDIKKLNEPRFCYKFMNPAQNINN